jgi:hypothetical protein
MSLHPDDRPESVRVFREAFFGPDSVVPFSYRSPIRRPMNLSRTFRWIGLRVSDRILMGVAVVLLVLAILGSVL